MQMEYKLSVKGRWDGSGVSRDGLPLHSASGSRAVGGAGAQHGEHGERETEHRTHQAGNHSSHRCTIRNVCRDRVG